REELLPEDLSADDDPRHNDHDRSDPPHPSRHRPREDPDRVRSSAGAIAVAPGVRDAVEHDGEDHDADPRRQGFTDVQALQGLVDAESQARIADRGGYHDDAEG